MTDTCSLYIPVGSKVYSAAKGMADTFEQLLTQAFDKSNNRPPSVEDLSLWADLCFKLTHKELGNIINLLDDICPTALIKNVPLNEIRVDVDLLSASAYHESLKLIKSFFPADDDEGTNSSSRDSYATDVKEYESNDGNHGFKIGKKPRIL